MRELNEIRVDINKIDEEMRELFIKRMQLASEIAAYKIEHELPITDSKREEEVIAKNLSALKDSTLSRHYADFIKATIEISKNYQRALLSDSKADV